MNRLGGRRPPLRGPAVKGTGLGRSRHDLYDRLVQRAQRLLLAAVLSACAATAIGVPAAGAVFQQDSVAAQPADGDEFPNRFEAVAGGAFAAVVVGTLLVVYSWSADPLPGRHRIRRPRRRRSGEPAPWGAAAPLPTAAATVPLPWQTVKPSPEAARAARPPVAHTEAGGQAPPPSVAPTPPAEVPSAEVPPAAATVPAGWYPDPAEPTRARWWDGSTWTDHVR